MENIPFTDYASKIMGLRTLPNIVYSAVEKGYENGATIAFSHATPEIINPSMIMLINWIVGANANNGQYITTLYGSVDGVVYEKMGDMVKARAEWRNALKVQVNHSGALKKLS